MPRIRHSKDKAERRNLKIEEKLDTLNVPPIDSPGAATTSTSEDGASLVPPSSIAYRVLTTPLIFQPVDAWSDVHSLCKSSRT